MSELPADVRCPACRLVMGGKDAHFRRKLCETCRKAEKEYRWWFWDLIETGVEQSAKEHAGTRERLAHVPDESFKQYVDEDGRVFEVNVHVECLGMDY